MGQRADWLVEHNATMVEDFLKLCRCFAALARGKIGFSSYINGVQIGPIIKTKRRLAKFIGSSSS
jgi:hypothetical protein